MGVLTISNHPENPVFMRVARVFAGETTYPHQVIVRAIVEHPFRVVKRQFGFVKVRYRGLVKNTGQIVTLFVLANLLLVRKRMLHLVGEVRP